MNGNTTFLILVMKIKHVLYIYIYISFLLGVGIAETTMVKNCSGNFPSTQNYSGNL